MITTFQLTIYIAGPMTGLPDFNRSAFQDAEIQLVKEGFDVINPAHNHAKDWTGYMRKSLAQVALADGLFMLQGWENSKGAKLEHMIAQELGLVIRYQGGNGNITGLMAETQEKNLKEAAHVAMSQSQKEMKGLMATHVKLDYHDVNLLLKRIERMSPAERSSLEGDAMRRLRAVLPP